MTVTAFDTKKLFEPHGFHHWVSATGTRTVYTSGVVGIHADGVLAGEGLDYRAHGHQAIVNLHAALQAARAGQADVSKLTMYVVDPTEEGLTELYRGIGRAANEIGAVAKATTLIGVTALSIAGAVYEVDAVAIVAD